MYCIKHVKNVRFFSTKRINYKGMTGGQIINHKLKQYGVNTVFGYSGGAILPFLDSFHNDKIKFIANSDEQCCGHSAEGYAKATGKTGIIVATSGPGTTNLITPLQDALGDGIPLIAFTGQVATEFIGTDAFQECPAIKLTEPCTKWNHQITDVNTIPTIIDLAFYWAQHGRPGPIHIDLPKDITMTKVKNDLVDLRIGENMPYNWDVNINKLKENLCNYDFNENNFIDIVADNKIINLNDDYRIDVSTLAYFINHSSKPVIFAGKGCNKYSHLLRKFATKANIPVTTSLHGLGCFDEDHKLSLKMVGMHGSYVANNSIQNADLIIGIGVRFDDRTVGNAKKYAPDARIIAINIEDKHMGLTCNIDHLIQKDVGKALLELNDYVRYKKRNKWLRKIDIWRRKYPFKIQNAKNNKIKDQNVLKMINKYKKNNTIITTGVGNHQMFTAQHITWKLPNKIITSGSLGTMGAGLPFAIGAKIGKPNYDVICIDGDASFNMTNNDLRTIMEYDIPVKIAIMNNSRQQMVHVWQTLFFDKKYIATSQKNPDYNKLAEAYNIKSLYCDNMDTLEDTIKEFIRYPGPVLCNFITVPDICLPLVAPGKALNEMVLEDNINNAINKLDKSDIPC